VLGESLANYFESPESEINFINPSNPTPIFTPSAGVNWGWVFVVSAFRTINNAAITPAIAPINPPDIRIRVFQDCIINLTLIIRWNVCYFLEIMLLRPANPCLIKITGFVNRFIKRFSFSFTIIL
jgi:hypothetical protein